MSRTLTHIKNSTKTTFFVDSPGAAAHAYMTKPFDVKGDVMKASAVASPDRLYASRSRSHGCQFAQYQLNPIRNRTAMPTWLRVIGVLLIVSIAGCAGTHVTEPQFRLPPGSKIAVVEGSFDKELFDQELFNSQDRARRESGPPIQNPVGGAVVGAAGGTAVGAIAGFGCGPLFVLCVPIGAAVGLVGGGVAGAVKGAQNAEQYSNKEAKSEGSAKPSLDIAVDKKIKDVLELIEKSLPTVTPIPERAKHLVSPLSDQPDYVFEFAPPEVKFAYIVNNTYLFRIVGRARLMRLSDKSVVDKFVTYENISFSPEEITRLQKPENPLRQVQTIEAALNKIAAVFVNYWIIPLNEGRDVWLRQ